MQFGSLSMPGGENRLNVAVTRAREKVIVVSSIWPEELKLQGIKNEGPKLLRAYLEYVRSTTMDKEIPIPNNSSHPGYLTTQLQTLQQSRNGSVLLKTSNLPFSDLVAFEGKNYLGVVLTDDASYKKSLTVKEPMAYVPFLLQEKNWKHARFFSRVWWMDPEKVEGDLQRFVYAVQPNKV
jgi:hypothetical protein